MGILGMVVNPYQAPTYDEPEYDELVAPERDLSQVPFYRVGLLKLACMSLLTCGFYEIFWFERQFRHQAAHNRERGLSIFRAVFAFFFVQDLVLRVERARRRELGIQSTNLRSLAALYMGLILVCRGGLHIMYFLLGDYAVAAGFAAGLFTFMPLVRVQLEINRVLAHSHPQQAKNRLPRLWEIVMAVAGVSLTWYLGYYPLSALIEISLF
ncbi:MAG: hypothetical protein AB7S68_31680 [Polyangiaceae bacterium]